ncbi:roadblock/LC7 domain-containing protein [Streptomyces sp. Ru87]|uniref:roadblock/LC7 domain-containing protein n=1 Tax=Streptomyces sp. Ru87 TaxID=2044307 RepID=UPI000BF7D8BF|nr:roadblock/LC7 domain-containing protein [Streptomyces sp. Ru87]PGH50013.1 dynein regulation protein LC7 [Streptomyces sp. Ru87]
MMHRSMPELTFLLKALVEKVPRTRCAVLLASDGLVRTVHGVDTDTADRLAAAASGLYALGQELGSEAGETGAVRQVLVDVGSTLVAVATGGAGARLLVAADQDVDVAVLGYEMGALATAAGAHMRTPPRHTT